MDFISVLTNALNECDEITNEKTTSCLLKAFIKSNGFAFTPFCSKTLVNGKKCRLVGKILYNGAYYCTRHTNKNAVSILLNEQKFNEICMYVFASGKVKGTKCSKQAVELYENSYYCSHHYKSKAKKNNISNNQQNNYSINSSDNIKFTTKPEIELREGKYYIKGTSYLWNIDLKSCSYKVHDKEVVPLNDSDFEILKTLTEE